MGYKVIANQDKIHYGVKSFVVDTINDIKRLPPTSAGSTAYCITAQQKFIKDTQGNWRPMKSGGSIGYSDLEGVDLIFDGTEVTQNDNDSFDDENTLYVWDGGVVAPNADIDIDYIWEGGAP